MGKHSSFEQERERQRIALRIAENTGKLCSCRGCTRDRYKLSPYCTTHYNRYRRHGSPDGRIPTRKELRALDDVIRHWIEDGLSKPIEVEGFRKIWASAVVRLRRPASKAKGLWFLEGDTGLTQVEKADIILANYLHRSSKPLGMAMLRWMSCRLWTELCFELPAGKTNVHREKRHFYNLFAGQYVVGQAGLSRETVEEVTVGYRRSIFAQEVGSPSNLEPITEIQRKRKTLLVNKSANIARAIGRQLGDAVGHAMGNSWQTNLSLQEKARQALSANT